MSKVKPVDMLSDVVFSGALKPIFATEPMLTRLEPQSVSGDPRHGADAVVADALWMIGRQWQLGELTGEDTGSPVSVRVERRALPITAWAPAGGDGVEQDQIVWRPWPEGALLDELVEHQDRPADHDLRWRARTGAVLARMLAEAGAVEAEALLLEACPLALAPDPHDPEGRFDSEAEQLLVAMGGNVPDGAAAAAELASGTPRWVSESGAAEAAAAAAAEWAAWAGWAGSRSGEGGEAWTSSRLEHRFLLRFGHGDDGLVVRATGFGTGSARWHHFEWLDGTTVDLDGDAGLPAVGVAVDVMLATPMRYPGMPADRYWQLEDGDVDLGAIEAQPQDLARLCLAEFALVSGDDWLVIPVDMSLGAVNQVLAVQVTDTFGQTVTVEEDGAARRARGFRMFEVTDQPGEKEMPGVLLPPIASTPLVGEPVEEVAFVRDETANMAWAVERVVRGRSGAPRLRSAEPRPPTPAAPEGLDPNTVVYEFARPVPRHWIPLVPTRVAPATVALRKGAMLDGDGEPVLAASQLLAPTPLTFPDEEIPREGITVRVVPVLARRPDGSYARWTGHRISVGRGEGNSGFASDSARPAGGPALR